MHERLAVKLSTVIIRLMTWARDCMLVLMRLTKAESRGSQLVLSQTGDFIYHDSIVRHLYWWKQCFFMDAHFLSFVTGERSKVFH